MSILFNITPTMYPRPLQCTPTSFVVAMVLFAGVPRESSAETPLHVAPGSGELSVYDVGEYAAVPWQKPGTSIEPGSRADRVRDLNLAVASVNLRDEMPVEFLARWADAAKWGKQQGKKFLPRVYFWDGKDRYTGPMRDIEVYWRRLDQFLAAMDLDDFCGIVLAEENVSYAGRPEVLTELYRRIKAKYDVDVWQWWSPSTAVPGSGGWIPADGWIVDPYFTPKASFRRFVRKYLITGLPLVAMPWATTAAKAEPLSPEQWHANSDQLDVAVEFDLPVAFYWTYGLGAHGTSCHFGCDRGEPNTEWDRINHWVWDYTKRARSLPADYTGLPSADIGTGDTLEIGPTNQSKLVYVDDFSTSRCIDDASITGFRDLVLDGKTLAARGFRDRETDASLVYHFAGDFVAQYPIVSVTADADGTLDGRAEIAISTDGKNWLHQAATEANGDQGLVCSSLGDKRFSALGEFWVRVRLAGQPGSGKSHPVRIDDLRIEATVPPPKDLAVRLKRSPEDPKRLFYEDDFQTQKYRITTTRTNDEHLEWARGQIAVRMRPSGSKPALVWTFKSDQPLRNIVVEATGRANTGYLGTNHYLDVSTDGRIWSHEVNTLGREFNVSGWAGHGLTIDLSGQADFARVTKFYVRLRLSAQHYKEKHRSLSGLVHNIRIEATADEAP